MYNGYIGRGGAAIMIFNSIFDGKNEDINWTGFWSELGVNYSKIIEEEDVKAILNQKLSNLHELEVENICSILGLNINEKAEMIKTILEDNRSFDIIYLIIFLKRKKKSVNDMYNYLFYNEDSNYLESTALVKLFHIFIKDHTYLFDIVALWEWQSKGTGVEYITDKMSKTYFDKFSEDNNLEKLCSFMSKTPKVGTDYKIRMHCTYNDKRIYVIYKLKNDSQKTDFDEAKRVKDIDIILFELDEAAQIVHIKSRTIGERAQLKRYFENYFGCKFEEVESPVYDDYDADEFKEVFYNLNNSTKVEVSNFYVNKIVFSSSLLNKSPEVTFNTPKRDVWPSVVHAFEMRVLDIDSLYCIKEMHIDVNDKSRTIRIVGLKDGSIIFKLDDKGLDKSSFEIINSKFKAKFGIPLNTRVKNKLDRGIADEIDTIMRCTTTKQVENYNQEIIRMLTDDNIIEIQPIKRFVCKNISCGTTFDISTEDIKECPDCSSDEFDIQEYESINVNHKKVENFIVNFLCNSINLKKADIEKSDKFSGYKVIRFLRGTREYNIVIADKIISRKVIKSIEKKLVPTIIIYYGIDNNQAKLMTPNTIEMLQFATLYANKDDGNKNKVILNSVFDNLEKRLHYQVVKASILANEDLATIVDKPSKISKKYLSSDFEDDIYALLKDIVFKSEKWGSAEIGKPLPEGVLAFEYSEVRGGDKKECRYAFTFDCKLTYKDEGYNLSIEEKRKAIEYVNKFNSTNEIKRYCTKNSELSAHIFIGNQFKDSQIDGMNKYFRESINEGNSTKPVFIDFKDLLKFHSWYRVHYEGIQKHRDYFYEELYKVFTINDRMVTYDDFKEIIYEIEDCFKNDKDINISRMKEKVLN